MVNYRCFAESAIGAGHIKEGKCCQDYSMSYKSENLAIIAVADGHGSVPHIRSDRGARFACKSALSSIRALIGAKFPFKNLAHHIVSEWNRQVSEDWNKDPANIAEIGETIPSPTVLYGTTLIAVAILPNSCFGIQIGDGKCVILATDGTVTQPIPWDEDCHFNYTTSICEPDAESRFRHFFMTKRAGEMQGLPAAIFINTDGVDNSYPLLDNDVQLGKLYSTIAANFIKQGFEKGIDEMREFLPMLTKRGSGDDVSIAGLIDMENTLWRGI
jgi:hypothetical protein